MPPTPPDPPQPPGLGRFPMDQEQITDPERMKALAHPARMEVFDYLGTRRIQGFDGATATEIAEVAGMTPSAMSYHLRTLAKAGFIEEAPSRGDARERVWRLKVHSFSIKAEKDASESDKVVEQAMVRTFTDQEDRTFRRALEVMHQLDPEIRELSTTSHGRMRLKPEEIEEFKDRLLALIHEYAERSIAYAEEGAPDDGTLVMHYLFRLFPHVHD
ncbi:winged helix-turn-helix domain-containing protein [Glycomyces tenuis]|uniref:winged helix-turn-helix domain-containing protein n=2 Tax=Glycomyces tenuis TaxID=58116 RepID=UPI001B8008EF|nr:helix-turn-helix domain-containing protein [Glycomyces tenuis]